MSYLHCIENYSDYFFPILVRASLTALVSVLLLCRLNKLPIKKTLLQCSIALLVVIIVLSPEILFYLVDLYLELKR